jgi:DNA-binding IclR family transcriptional regulator
MSTVWVGAGYRGGVTTERAVKRGPDRSVLQSVQRAAAVMDEVARRRGPVAIGELAATLQLDRTIVYRIVRTLEGEGLLESGNGGYTIGGRALLFGNAYLDTLTVRRVALPYQVDLLDRVLKGRPWTTSILVPVGAEVAMVDTVYNTAAPLDIQLSMGRRFPIARTAVGRSIMAFLSEQDVVALLGDELTDDLTAELARIRQDGVAFVHDFVPGVSAMAAPIFDRFDTPIAGLLLSGLELEEHLVPTSDVARTLRRTADAISQMLH